MSRHPFLTLLLLLTGCVTSAPPEPSSFDTATTQPPDANQAIASGVAGSDIWVGRLARTAGNWRITGLVNITTRPGYDNQPAFSADGQSIYYSSIRDAAQADIYEYDWRTQTTRRLTTTPQSEFSPIPLGKGFSVVRVETDGRQRLCRYVGRSHRPVTGTPDTVGYYTWLDDTRIAMFLVDEPPRLAIATLTDGALHSIISDPGRSLHHRNNVLYFVDKRDAEHWWISAYDTQTGQTKRIAETLSGSEDLAWAPDGQLLMAQQRRIYVWHDGWQEIINLDERIPGAINRLTIHPDSHRIAFVAAEGMP